MNKSLLFILVMASATAFVACGEEPEPKDKIDVVFEEPECRFDGHCTDNVNGPICDLENEVCVAGCLSNVHCTEPGQVCNIEEKQCEVEPRGTLIGTGDGSAQSVEFVQIYKPATPIETTDLEFHPDRNELWVLNREFEVEGKCVMSNLNSPRCESLWGQTTIIKSPGTAAQFVQVLVDQNSWHFMRRPSSMAMGAKETFATCGEAATGNFEDNDVNYIGPSLWSNNLSIYAQPSGGNGSHLDMLHATPFCMGMAHERDNIYWVFNGHVGAIDRYDFKADHGPGNDYHGDGEVFRYIPGQVKRVPNVPSHMVFNKDDNHVYIADTGNARIIKLNTTMGTLGQPFIPVYEELAAYGFMNETSMTQVVSDENLVQPSGLAIHKDTIYVSDHATGKLLAFGLNGELIRSLETPLGAGSLTGITIGPDEKIWFADKKTGTVYTIRPKS